MTQIETIISVLEFISQVMGTQTEIVVHDLINHKIKWISNGQITGRSAEDTDDPTILNITRRRAMESSNEDMIVGGSSYTRGTTRIRTSTMFLKDADNKYRYAICVNQEMTHVDAMQKYLEQFFLATPFTVSETTSKVDDSIETLTKQLIFDEIEREKPFSSDSREAKLSIIQRLEEKGVFEVKGSIPIVCEFLQIAQATLYKYLKEIKQSKSESI